MLCSADVLVRMKIHATDGDLGAVEEFYFDDESWTVRYFVVKSGGWLSGRRVLITPTVIRSLDWDRQLMSVSLTMDQIRHSPDIDTKKPVSRLQESQYHTYFNQTPYWAHGVDMALLAVKSAARATAARAEAQGAPPPTHLRSSAEVTGYHIEASDGSIGHVEDFVIDDASWRIRFVVVNTSNWGLGRNVVIAPEWVERISWGEKKLHVAFERAAIERSPAYESILKLTPHYEAALERHYGLPFVWK